MSVINLINDAQKSMTEKGIWEDEILSVHDSTIILYYITNTCFDVHIEFKNC